MYPRRLLLVAVVLHAVPSTIAFGDSATDTAEKNWETAKQSYKVAIEKTRQEVFDHISGLEDRARNRGDADKVKQYKGERAAFEENGTLPTFFDRFQYNSKRRTAERDLRAVFEKLETVYLKSGRDADAQDLAEELRGILSPQSTTVSEVLSGSVLHVSFERATVSDLGTQTIVKNLSGRNNHGVVHGATRIAEGRFGDGMLFVGGNDHISIRDRELPDQGQARTITFWLKTTKRGGVLFFYGNHVSLQSCHMVLDDRGAAVVGNAFGGAAQRAGAAVVADGKWHFVALAMNGRGRTKLYVDGRVDLEFERPWKTVLTGEFILGNGHTKMDGFNGILDEVAIYARELSESQIGKMFGSRE